MRIRSYLPPQEWNKKTVQISGPEAHHLTHVLRVGEGATVICFDGQGHEAEGTIRKIGRGDLCLHLGEKKTVPPPSWQLTLGVAIPGGGKLDQIIDQSTQLGISRIIPLTTARTVVKISVDARAKKQARWKQIAVTAGKQSGVSRLPDIGHVTSWRDFIQSFKAYDLVLMATTEGPYEKLSPLLADLAIRQIALLIGPEGDFTPQEIEEATGAGAHRISLGPTILRCDTAVAAAVVLVSYFLRERGTR